MQPYLDDPEFEPDFIRAKSAAAAGICAWAINIIRFYHVFCDVEPKRQALAAANAELAAAEEKLARIKAKIAELDDNLSELTASFEKVVIELYKPVSLSCIGRTNLHLGRVQGRSVSFTACHLGKL